ncbi:D-arabitol-phosphate dehydrogenase [Paenibacillus solanacearum]|uniref:D-arabitol-phosphate dehydrogenase n=1 Tax=Paenibacillus solanacearum TaxID=2048548 RepID=A0A916JRG2_9BACL|nr:zinc-binding alcohol dehydrogenase [Paenibacillus solanacearum]CAG7596167.1 D-arabitol-phosphate dehydrogenase [Paenibacillus solanacearum]
MKALFAYEGNVVVKDDEVPALQGDDMVLIRTAYSTVSPGTEMTAVRRSKQSPLQLGYSAAGVVVQAGANAAAEFPPGRRVACYGGPYVRHAEYLAVHKHLVAAVPDHVTLAEASTAGLGTIAVHAVRQASLQFGETVVVVGLGILGQIIARICQAACLRVVACDLLPARRKAMRGTPGIHVCEGLEEVGRIVADLSGGLGADAVLHCASGQQRELLDASFEWIRDRGKVVIVGDLNMEFTRAKMFKKEAQVLISRAGGPGRYDPMYEASGFDYPEGYVRWTEGRNLQEYIRLLAGRHIDIGPLLNHSVTLSEAYAVYGMYKNDPASILGAVIAYETAN